MPLTMTRRIVTFQVVGIPMAKGNAHAFVPRKWAAEAAARGTSPRAVITLDHKKSKGWEQLVREQAQSVTADGLFTGPVAMALVFHLPRPTSLSKGQRHHVVKPDIDKLARCCLDALTGVLYADDKVVVDLRVRKVYAETAAPPCVQITVADALAPQPDQSALDFSLTEDL